MPRIALRGIAIRGTEIRFTEISGADAGNSVILCPELAGAELTSLDSPVRPVAVLAAKGLPCTHHVIKALAGTDPGSAEFSRSSNDRLARCEARLVEPMAPAAAGPSRPVPFGCGGTVGGNGVQGGQLPEFRRYRGLETTAVFTQAVIPINQPEALRGYVYTISGVLAAFCPH